MFIERQNPRGGKRLRGFKLHIKDDKLGYMIGYHQGEPIMIRISDAEEICESFGYSIQRDRGIFQRFFN